MAFPLLVLLLAGGLTSVGGARFERRAKTDENSTSTCLDFLVIGDWGSGKSYQSDVARGMSSVGAKKNYKAVISVGDNIYEKGAEGSTSRILSRWADYYMKYDSLKKPWYTITGNHDWLSDPRVERDFTTSSKNVGGYWQMPSYWYKKSFTTAGGITVDMFFLDTQVWRRSNNINDQSYDKEKLYSNQKAWINAELPKSTADWKIVVGHHPVYSAGNHGATSELLNELDPLMRSVGANIYIAGHDHTQQLIQYDGMHYVVSGAGGKTARTGTTGYPEGSLVHNYRYPGFASLHICNKSGVELVYYNSSGSVDSRQTLPKTTPGGGGDSTRRRRRRRRDSARASEEADVVLPSDLAKAQGLAVTASVSQCRGMTIESVEATCSDDGCTVIADKPSTKSCDKFCAESGLACESAWKEEEEDCHGSEQIACDEIFVDSIENAMCRCVPV